MSPAMEGLLVAVLPRFPHRDSELQQALVVIQLGTDRQLHSNGLRMPLSLCRIFAWHILIACKEDCQ